MFNNSHSRVATLLSTAAFVCSSFGADPASNQNANNTVGDTPKLTQDGPGGLVLSGPTGDPLAKTTSSANASERRIGRPMPVNTGYDAIYNCKLTDQNSIEYRIPIATRWWFSGPQKTDTSVCVVVGLGSATNATTSAPTSVQISRKKNDGSFVVVPMKSPSVSLGGALTATSAWSNKTWGTDMTAGELCSSAPVTRSEHKALHLTLTNRLVSAGGGSCVLPIGSNPRPPLEAKAIPVEMKLPQ